jgi:subtilisin family serine protease
MPRDRERGAGPDPAGALAGHRGAAGPSHVAGADYVPGELIVRFDPGTSASERQSLNAAQNADVRRALLVPRAYLLRLPKDRDVGAAQRAYERNPNVQYAEPNYVGQLFATPNDPFFTNSPFRMWAMHNTGQDFGAGPGTPDADIDAPEAWDVTTGSAAVTVGIADTGIDYNHPDLAANIWHNPGESGGGKETNGVDDDGNGKIDDFRGWDFTENDNDPQDYESHGSHVAGTVGAVGNDGQGVPGVNWTVRVAALRVCSPDPFVQCSTANQADAFAYAGQMGMKVVNGSFGSNASQAVQDAIGNASDTLFVFAAGNGGADGVGDDNDTAQQYPCGYPKPNVICVAATDHNDNRASFSNYGDVEVDLAAPGTNILSTWPDVVRFRESFEAADFATKWTTGGTNNTWNRLCLTPTTPPAAA